MCEESVKRLSWWNTCGCGVVGFVWGTYFEMSPGRLCY